MKKPSILMLLYSSVIVGRCNPDTYLKTLYLLQDMDPETYESLSWLNVGNDGDVVISAPMANIFVCNDIYDACDIIPKHGGIHYHGKIELGIPEEAKKALTGFVGNDILSA